MNRNATILIFAAALFCAVFGFAYGTVFNAGCRGFENAGAIAGCAEFFVFRYQTLIGIAGAIIAALITARPVWRQLTEMARQSDFQALDYLRQRSVELDHEQTLIYKISSSLQIASDALVALAGTRRDQPSNQIFGMAIVRFQAAETYMNETIVEFDRDIGPLWGTAPIHQARATVKDDAQRFSNTLRKFSEKVVPGVTISDAEFDALGRSLAPLKDSVMAAAAAVHIGIVKERESVSARIATLEGRL